MFRLLVCAAIVVVSVNVLLTAVGSISSIKISTHDKIERAIEPVKKPSNWNF